jgi:L-threonylcarbamoyladenylate synthase
MENDTWKMENNNTMDDHIKKATEVIKKGGIVIFPTDTAFGIGCRIDNRESVEKLFSVRKRPTTQPMPILCNTIEMVEQHVTDIPKEVKERLMEGYWPGGLTIILPADLEKVPGLVRGGSLSVGVRIPKHDGVLSMITGAGVPILGPSANFHGEKTPYQLSDINPELIYLTDYIVPGGCTLCRESTVIDCTESPWKVIRQGAVKVEL